MDDRVNEMIKREPLHQQAFACYQKYICGARSFTAIELHTIPSLVDLHGIDLFREVVYNAGCKAELYSPIKYIEAALTKEAKRKLDEALDAAEMNARQQERDNVKPYSDKTRIETLKKAAAAGNVIAKAALKGLESIGDSGSAGEEGME